MRAALTTIQEDLRSELFGSRTLRPGLNQCGTKLFPPATMSKDFLISCSSFKGSIFNAHSVDHS
jgi:hypothetical protein